MDSLYCPRRRKSDVYCPFACLRCLASTGAVSTRPGYRRVGVVPRLVKHRQNHWHLLRDNHRVLIMRRQRPIMRAQGPPIGILANAARPRRDQRLDGDHKPFSKDISLIWIVEIRYRRFLVNRAAHAPTVRESHRIRTTAPHARWHGQCQRRNDLPAPPCTRH